MNNNGNGTAEEWRDIPGFVGKYQVSNHGRIKSLKYYAKCSYAKILKPLMSTKYVTVNLGAKNTKYVHRLVAQAFVSNPNPDLFIEVNHEDFNKHNNLASNLTWCDHDANMKHAHAAGRVVFSKEAREKISRGVKRAWALKRAA